MPRFLIQRVQEVVVEAPSYPGAVQMMKELNQSLFWEERQAATFVLPGQLHMREPELRRDQSGVHKVPQKEGTTA